MDVAEVADVAEAADVDVDVVADVCKKILEICVCVTLRIYSRYYVLYCIYICRIL